MKLSTEQHNRIIDTIASGVVMGLIVGATMAFGFWQTLAVIGALLLALAIWIVIT